ncbi:MAG: inositol monophosphatase family protein [Pyrinomonadaceae bacterium]
MNDIRDLLEPIQRLHRMIRDRVVEECERSSVASLSRVVADDEGDTIFAVDRVSEELLVEFIEREIASKVPIVLIAEGIEGGKVILPRGSDEREAAWRILVDPIDGTRGLMYQKRSAWVLTGVAANRGDATSLADIELAVQTEIPLVKQHLSDMLWAVRGEGFSVERFNRVSGETSAVHLSPSKAPTIEQGYATISRFFPGYRGELAAIDDEVVARSLGAPKEGKAQCFEDQYISTGGQLYELIAGHDRFIADLRPLMRGRSAAGYSELSICCHPYDLATELIAREAGVIITGVDGSQLEAPLNVKADVAWIGYANEQIRQQIEPHLATVLKERRIA